MSLRLYMDVHVPAAITQALRRRGIDVLTSQEDGTREATDELLLRRASQLGRLLFTQDHDLLRIAHEWQLRREAFPGLVFAKQQGMSLGRCIEDLELITACCLPHEVTNDVIFLPLD